jgi:hypothetical protein
MKVKELIAKLEKLDKDFEVFCYIEADGLLLYEIDEISVNDGERARLEDGKQIIKSEKGNYTTNTVLISITNDF